jgi:hypothetical protein
MGLASRRGVSLNWPQFDVCSTLGYLLWSMPYRAEHLEVLRDDDLNWRVAVNNVLTAPRFRTDVEAATYAAAIRSGHPPDFGAGGAPAIPPPSA